MTRITAMPSMPDNFPFPEFIARLYGLLHDKPLPGIDAHLRMAHAVRKVDTAPDPATKKDAAVLVTFFEKKPQDWHILFIRRTGKLEKDKHAGQIAFPGGKKDPSDRDLVYTALREAEEEIALDLTAIDVLGALTPLYIPVSRFLVHPFVAYARHVPPLVRQEREIEEILEFSWTQIKDPQSRQEARVRLGPDIVLNHVPAFQIGGETIWGATAMIMNELLELTGQT